MTTPAHLFVGCEGDLYDTRNANWSKAPLRAGFSGHATRINTAVQLKAALRAGRTTDLGGYPLYFVMADGEAASFRGVRDNLALCLAAFAGHDDQWRVVGCEVNYEATDLVCCITNEPLPAAYAD